MGFTRCVELDAAAQRIDRDERLLSATTADLSGQWAMSPP